MRRFALAVAFLPASAVGLAAEAGAPAGKVKRSEGSVAADHPRQVQTVQVGRPGHVGDRLRAGAEGSVGTADEVAEARIRRVGIKLR